MMLSIPNPPEGSPSSGDELAWRRELKQLRVRVAQLEAERGLRQQPSIEVKRGAVHGYQCGRPCNVVVSEEQPRVECAACGTRLDAIEVLRDYAQHERNFCYSLEHLRKEKRELTAEVEKLKKLVQRLRGKVRLKIPDDPSDADTSAWSRTQWKNWLVDGLLAQLADLDGGKP